MARTVGDVRAAVAGFRRAGAAVGLVPTMGALHRGHVALVLAAKAAAPRVVASLFVNPTQFGPNEDFQRYPRDEAKDRAMLAEAGCDLLYAPAVEAMYPPGFATTVSVGRLTDHLCGPFRPGHFDGVATVVAKLLTQAMPDRAFFGEKDFQQLQVIRRMARDLDLPVAIEGIATIREPDGLALSSRNAYLSPAERQQASALYRVLSELAERVARGAPCASEAARAREALTRAGFARIDYVTVADEAELQPLDIVDRPARAFAAAWLGRTRLIDNVPVPRG